MACTAVSQLSTAAAQWSSMLPGLKPAASWTNGHTPLPAFFFWSYKRPSENKPLGG